MNQKILDAVKGRDDADKILSGLKITETTQASEKVLKAIAETIRLVNAGMRVEEAAAKASNGRTESSQRAAKPKDAITPAQSQPVVPSTVPLESMPGGVREGINSIAEDHVKSKRPHMLDKVSQSLTGTTDGIIEAATGYASHTVQEMWGRELNDPTFLEDLQRSVETGKSQT